MGVNKHPPNQGGGFNFHERKPLVSNRNIDNVTHCLVFAKLTLFLSPSSYPACPATSSQTFKPEACNKALINSPWCSPSPMSHSPVPSSTPVEPSSRPSPVSLTVSPSLKSPSFLAQRGTYSFRICPPSNLLGEGKKQRGVALPGGFTLIQLPKPRVDEAAGPVGPPNGSSSGKPPKSSTASRLDHLAKEWLGVGSLDKVTDLSRLICDPKTRLEESSRSLEEVESNISVEDLSSDFSSSGEGEDDVSSSRRVLVLPD